MQRQRLIWIGWKRAVATAALGVIASIAVASKAAGADAVPAEMGPVEPTSAARLHEIQAKWQASDLAYYLAPQESKPEGGKSVVRATNPAAAALALEMVELAESSPDDAAVPGGMVFVLQRLLAPFEGPPAELERRAIDILIEHHADEPEVARALLQPNGMFSPNRERLLRGLVAKASQPETAGLARLALGLYLTSEADAFAQLQAGFTRAPPATDRAAAYQAYARGGDVAAARRDAETQLDEVKARYSDVPFVRAGGRVHPRRKTLGEAAESVLDELRHMALGQPAPEIDATDLAGKPLKLSDYHGKVVVIVFWASWCGPCVAEIPQERALLERLEGQPFALLGVNADENPEAAQKAADKYGAVWPNWNDPATAAMGEGPITDRYHVHSLPQTVVLDQAGIVRAKNVGGDRLETIVNDLLPKR